jgi:hypothetical protein
MGRQGKSPGNRVARPYDSNDKRLWAASMVLRQLPLWLGKPSMRLLALLVLKPGFYPPEIAPRKHHRPPKRQDLVDLQVAQAF